MNEEQLTKFTEEHNKHLDRIGSFMIDHNISEINLCESDIADAKMDIVFTEQSKSRVKVIMELIEMTPEMAEWMNEILSPYIVPIEDMEVT